MLQPKYPTLKVQSLFNPMGAGGAVSVLFSDRYFSSQKRGRRGDLKISSLLQCIMSFQKIITKMFTVILGNLVGVG